MLLEDILSGGELLAVNEDDPASSKKFGKQGQLSVIGMHWHYRNSGARDKHYVVKCAVCSEDAELFGDGCFSASRRLLMIGSIPCGCSKSPKWTEEQFLIRMDRAASKNNYIFEGWAEDYRGVYTKSTIICPVHGEWHTSPMSFINMETRCGGCVKPELGRVTGSLNRREDGFYIAEFLKTGMYSKETIFSRVKRKVGSRESLQWLVNCETCGDSYYSTQRQIKAGRRSCSCNPILPTGAYILLICESGLPIGIKFGISKDFKTRVSQIQSKTSYDISVIGYWTFESPADCRAAESKCKRQFITGVIDKISFEEGWTETTFCYNLDDVVGIYEEYGGRKVEQ